MGVTARVNYHIKSVSPQAFLVDADGLKGSLVAPELVNKTVNVQDARNGEFKFAFNRDGIVFNASPTKVNVADESNDWRRIYEEEIQRLLKKEIGAQEVIVFDHTIRIDEPDAVRRPARNVHSDYSQSVAEQRLVDLLGENQAERFRNGGFGFVNVWRPIGSPVKSSPLGFIHPGSMQPEDWMTIDVVYPDRRGQVLGVAANRKHQWFYLSEMHPDEVAIFNVYDSRGLPQLAHSALDLTQDGTGPEPRKSIESRTLVRYN